MNSKAALALTAGVITGLALVVYAFTSSGFGKVSRPAYQSATALYGACMAADTLRLDKVEAVILAGGIAPADSGADSSQAAPTSQALMSDREKRWLTDIVAQARSGQWKSAAQSAKRMLNDQIQY